MIRLSRFIFQATIILALVVLITFFDSMKFEAVLVSAGVFFIGTFISYLTSDGRDIDDSNSTNLSRDIVKTHNQQGPLIYEVNEWANTSKIVMHQWTNNATDPFIQNSLLAFWSIGLRTTFEFVHNINFHYQHGNISKREYNNITKNLRRDRFYPSPYLIELSLSHITYFHMYNFSRDYKDLLFEKNFVYTKSFLEKLYDAMDLNLEGLQRYNHELKQFGGTQSKFFIRDFLKIFGMNEEDDLLVRIAETAFMKSYYEMMPELVMDTIDINY